MDKFLRENILNRIANYDFEPSDLAQYNYDRETVLTAVSDNGFALEYATIEQRDDEEIVRAALKDTGAALAYASERLRGNQEIVLLSLDGYSIECPFKYASQELKSDSETVRLAVAANPESLLFASDNFKYDKKLAMVLLKRNGEYLYDLPDEFKADRACVKAAIKSNAHAIRFADKSFLKDDEILKLVEKQDPTACKYDQNRHSTINSNKDRSYLISICGPGGQFTSEELDINFYKLIRSPKKSLSAYSFSLIKNEYDAAKKINQLHFEGADVNKCEAHIFDIEGNLLTTFPALNNQGILCLAEEFSSKGFKMHFKVSPRIGSWGKYKLSLEEDFNYARLFVLSFLLDETFGDFEILVHVVYVPKNILEDPDDFEAFLEEKFIMNNSRILETNIFSVSDVGKKQRITELEELGCIVLEQVETNSIVSLEQDYHFFT